MSLKPQTPPATAETARSAFSAKLWKVPGKTGWTFALIPAEHAVEQSVGWGRTPVHAVVDGMAWDTSVWADKKRGCLLAVPKHVRKAKGDGDTVTVELRLRGEDFGDEAARLAQWDRA